MATIDIQTGGTELGLAFQPPGSEQIPGSTILTRLNYYDGKFLRADDLRLEQDYLRRLAELGARAGGSGLVYGFDVDRGSGDLLSIGGGLAFDGAGRVLYMPASVTIGLQTLIDATRNALQTSVQATGGSSGFAICPPEAATTPPGPSGAEFYVITIAHAEEACGEEDVFGTLCDDGCATTTDRAYVVEGVVVRAQPFLPKTPFVNAPGLTEAHVRSQLVSAFFEDERGFVPCQISKAGLLSGIWCKGAAAPSGWEVPIAVVGRLSSSTFVDEWVVRRERIETPPRRYWEGRMCMRPWDVFLAQVLQFQCQLPSVLSGRGGDSTATDPCAPHTAVIRQVSSYMQELALVLGQPQSVQTLPPAISEQAAIAAIEIPPAQVARAQLLRATIADVLAKAKLPSQQILIDGGLVELPPAGYLPVTPGTTPPVDEQVRRLLGPGVDLRFCVASRDYVPRALESAQHMDRISLVKGIADPAHKPKVDVIVPDGQVGGAVTKPARGWDAKVTPDKVSTGIVADAASAPRFVHGVGRTAVTAAGQAEFEFAGLWEIGAQGTRPAAYGALTCDSNPFALDVNAQLTVNAEGAEYSPGGGSQAEGELYSATGIFTVASRQSGVATVEVRLTGTLTGSHRNLAGGVTTFESIPATLLIAYQATACTAQVTLGDGETPTRFTALLTEDAQVFSPQNAVHGEAQQALQQLADGFDDPSYTGARAAKLFDPTASSVGTDGLTATLDWVLFHRRREQDCTLLPVEPPPLPKTQTYRAFLAKAKTTAVVASITKAIAGNTASLTRYFHEIGLVQFQDASPVLATDPEAVLAAWKGLTPDGRIVLAATATEPGAADTLLRGRVQAYEAAVTEVSQPTTDEVTIHHPVLTRLAAGADGQLLFVTMPDTVGYEVLAALSDEGANSLGGLQGTRNVDAFRASKDAHAVGTITFAAGTATVAVDLLKDVAAAVGKAGVNKILRAFVFTPPGQQTTEDVKSQVAEIVKAVNGTEDPPFLVEGPIEAKVDTPIAGTSLVCVLSVLG